MDNSYNEDCQFGSSKHCVNQTCDRFTGKCLSECDVGYHGNRCDQGLRLLFLLNFDKLVIYNHFLNFHRR